MRLFRVWTVTVTVAESVGFLAPALVGVATADRAWQVALPALLGAGAVEGAVLGWAQATVLRSALPALRRARWVLATTAGAVTAYVLGVGMAAAGGSAPVWLQVALYPVLGLALLATIGGAQWLELRHHVAAAGRWVLWTAAAWLLALGAFLAIATPLWHEGQRPEQAVAVGVAAGVVMAAVQAAVTGWGLARLLAPPEQARQDGPLVLSAG